MRRAITEKQVQRKMTSAMLRIFFGHRSYIQQQIALNIRHTEFSAVSCDESIIRSWILMFDLTSQSPTPARLYSLSKLVISPFKHSATLILSKLLKTGISILSLSSSNYTLRLPFYFNLSSNILCCLLPLPSLASTSSIEFTCTDEASFKCRGLSFCMKKSLPAFSHILL